MLWDDLLGRVAGSVSLQQITIITKKKTLGGKECHIVPVPESCNGFEGEIMQMALGGHDSPWSAGARSAYWRGYFLIRRAMM